MAAGTYNVRKATCAGQCITCNGYLGVDEFDFLDGSIPVGSATTVTYSLLNNSGTYVNVSNSSTWRSSNAGIATVNAPGTAAGVTSGSFTAYATTGQEPEYDKFDCPTGDTAPCPEEQFTGNGPGIVVPKPTVTFSPISSVLVGQTATTTATVSPTSNALPISLSITSPAAIVSPTGTFTKTTAVVVKGMSVGTATITATISNPDGGNPTTVGSTSFQVIASQVPTSATIIDNVKTTYSNQTWTSCDGTQSANNRYGYQRCVTYQVNDQHGNAIEAVLAVQETVTTISQNINSNMSNGNSSTNTAGQFLDGLALLSTSALPSNACSIVKQSFTVTGNSSPIRVNCIQYGPSDVTVTDVTPNPASCSVPTYQCN